MMCIDVGILWVLYTEDDRKGQLGEVKQGRNDSLRAGQYLQSRS